MKQLRSFLCFSRNEASLSNASSHTTKPRILLYCFLLRTTTWWHHTLGATVAQRGSGPSPFPLVPAERNDRCSHWGKTVFFSACTIRMFGVFCAYYMIAAANFWTVLPPCMYVCLRNEFDAIRELPERDNTASRVSNDDKTMCLDWGMSPWAR